MIKFLNVVSIFFSLSVLAQDGFDIAFVDLETFQGKELKTTNVDSITLELPMDSRYRLIDVSGEASVSYVVVDDNQNLILTVNEISGPQKELFDEIRAIREHSDFEQIFLKNYLVRVNEHLSSTDPNRKIFFKRFREGNTLLVSEGHSLFGNEEIEQNYFIYKDGRLFKVQYSLYD